MFRNVVTCCSVALSLPLAFLPLRAIAQSPYGGDIKFYMHRTEQPGTVRLYRLLLADGTHCYTTSEAEIRTMTTSRKYQARVEPVDMFVYAEQKPGTVRLYRLTQRLADGGWRSFYTAYEPEMKEVRTHQGCELHPVKAYVFPHDYMQPTEFVVQEGRPGAGDVRDVMISPDPRLSQHNLGGMDQLGIWPVSGVTLIRFDLSQIPSNTTIRAASLELSCISVGFSEEEIKRSWTIYVSECSHEWIEGTGDDTVPVRNGATASTYDGTHEWPKRDVTSCAGAVMGSFVHEGNRRGPCKWDLNTEVVDGWISGKRPNHGLMIWGEEPGKAVAFAPSESPTPENRPMLRLAALVPRDNLDSHDIAPVYCCYNPVSAEHFYTTSEKERDFFVANARQAVAARQERESEQTKRTDVARAAEAQKAGPDHGPATAAQKLASIELGAPASEDAAITRRFGELIASIRTKGSPTDEQVIVAATQRGHSLLKAKGVQIGLLQFTEMLDKSISERIAKKYHYPDIVATFVLLATSEEFRGKTEEVPETVRATLEALLDR
jgi:hypothetical protein